MGIHSRLTYVGVTAAVAVVLAAVGVASAQAVVYEGAFTGLPGSSVQLKFVKHQGKRFLDEYTLSYTTTCENGPQPQSTAGEPSPRPRVRDRHFKLVFGDRNSNDFFRLVGDLKRSGKAVGAFRNRTNVGAPFGVCDTGTLDWVAFKQ